MKLSYPISQLRLSFKLMTRGLLAAIVCLAGISAQATVTKLRAIATTTMATDLVKTLGGEQVEVTGLMGSSVDPHLYKPTPADIRALRDADIIFYNGLHLEGRMTDILVKLARSGRPVYALSESVDESRLLSPEDFEGAHDPHIWLDAELWSQCADTVAEALSKQDPEHAATYRARAEKWKAELAQLHRWAREQIQTIPAERRVLVTSHDAFNYFGRAYGLEVIGVQGLSTVSEAGLADMVRVSDLIKSRSIPAIFVETSVSPAAIQRISHDSGARIGGELFSDAMGELGNIHTGANGETYDVGTWRGMFMHNVNTVVQGLNP